MNHQATSGSYSSVAPRRRALLAAAVLVAVALLAYIPAMRGGFFWDDQSFVYENKLIHAPDGLRRFWLTTDATDYFPLTSSMLWVEWRLWRNNPVGYHVINVLLHAACAILTWRVLRRLRVPGAWLAGLLFALHPVAAASGAWVTEGKNTLSLTLFLLSILTYLLYEDRSGLDRLSTAFQKSIGTSEMLHGAGGLEGRERPSKGLQRKDATERSVSKRHRGEAPVEEIISQVQSDLRNDVLSLGEGVRRWYALALGFFLFALFAKTSVVMLPVVLLLCAWWRWGRISRKDLLRSVPFFALSLALGLVTVWFQQRAIQGVGVRAETLASRVAASGWIAWFYLFKLLLPVGLCVIYPRWAVPGSRLLAFLPLLLLVAGMTLLWTRRKSWGRAPLFALAYFVIMLLPVLGFVDMSLMEYSLAADHLQYAAMIGVIAFAAGVLARARPEPSRRAAAAPAFRGRIGPVAAAGCAVVLGIQTWHRASLYGEDQRLWQDNLNKNPAAWLAWNNLGWTYQRAGLDEKAILFFDKALALKPDLAEAYTDRAAALEHLRRYAEAIDDCNKAIKLKPSEARAYLDRAVTLARLGRYAESLDDCNRAIALTPDFAEAYNNRAATLARLGRYAESLHDCDRAIKWNPGYAHAYNNRAIAHIGLGQYQLAVDDCSQAIDLDPDYSTAWYNRAIAHDWMGRYDLAIPDFDNAIRLKPGYAEAYHDRAVAFYCLKRYEQAWADVKMCRRLGGVPEAAFLRVLTRASGRTE